MKKILGVLIVFLLIGAMSLQNVSAESFIDKLEIKNIEGEILQQENDIQKNSDFVLKDLMIIHQDGIIKGEGSVTCEGVKNPFMLNGKLYPVRGEGYYAGKLILGDIESTEDYNVLQFRIENKVSNSAYNQYNNGESTILSIILEDKKTGEWVRFQQDVDCQFFKNFYQGSNVLVSNLNMEEDEVREKIVSLLNIHNKADYGEKIQKSIQVEEKGTADTNGNFSVCPMIDTQSWSTISINFKELNRLFKDLEDPYIDSVKLSNYNLPESLFKGSGWKKDVSIDTSPRWNCYAHSAEQIGYTITQITTFQHDSGFFDENDHNVKFDIAFTYKDGMVLEYDHYTKDLRVLQYGFGLEFQELQIAQGCLEDKNVYIAQTLYGKNLTKKGSSLISYLVSLIPHGSKLTDLWGALKHSKNEELGQRERFIGSTFEEQKNMHDGNVYRSISGTLNKWALTKEGANTNLVGEIHSGDGYVSLSWGFETSLGTSL